MTSPEPQREWELDAAFEKPDEALLAFGGCLAVGTMMLLFGHFVLVALCAVGAYFTGRHLLELAEHGARHRGLSDRHVEGRVLDAGGGQVGILVDRDTAVYPPTGRRCRLYLLDDEDDTVD